MIDHIKGLDEFLSEHPRMRLMPMSSDASITLVGTLELNHKCGDYPTVSEDLTMEIVIPHNLRTSPPVVRELSTKLPRDRDFHVYDNGELCLATPFRLDIWCRKNASIGSFVNEFVLPHLYAVMLKIRYQIDFVFGEFSHGDDGVYEDFYGLFDVSTEISVRQCLKAASLNRRVANKQSCPCGDNHRLGVCSLRLKINAARYLAPRCCYAQALMKLA